jgi:DNA-binding CsgD family transcriptional regulator
MLVMRSQNLAARSRCQEALAVGAREEEGQALNYLGGALAFLGDSEQAIAHLEEAVRISRAVAAGSRGYSEYENLGEVLADAGRIEQGLAVAREGIAVAREFGVQRSYGVVLMGRAALCALALGRVRDADQLTDEALDLGEESFFAFNALEARGRSEILRGEFAAAEERLGTARTMAARFGDLMWVGPIAAASSEMELWRSQPGAAAEIVAAALALAPERECLQHTSELHANGARAHADLAQAADALRETGDSERAARAATALSERLRERIRSSFPLGEPPARTRADAALCAAEASRAHAIADRELWRQAVEACDVFGHRPRAAYARWRLAETLLEHGDRTRAAAVLAQATSAATELGHTPLARALHALARRARISIADPADATRPDSRYRELGLSRREVEVLKLLAEGLTNRQIATELYITEKTAEHHVSRILSKLDVRTRGAAGSIAHRIGIDA